MDRKIYIAQQGKIYRNKKNQQLYRVVSRGFHTELEELTIGYTPLYPYAPYDTYYRPALGEVGFLAKFERVSDQEVEEKLIEYDELPRRKK
jgi:hypothetical protein